MDLFRRLRLARRACCSSILPFSASSMSGSAARPILILDAKHLDNDAVVEAPSRMIAAATEQFLLRISEPDRSGLKHDEGHRKRIVAAITPASTPARRSRQIDEAAWPGRQPRTCPGDTQDETARAAFRDRPGSLHDHGRAVLRRRRAISHRALPRPDRELVDARLPQQICPSAVGCDRSARTGPRAPAHVAPQGFEPCPQFRAQRMASSRRAMTLSNCAAAILAAVSTSRSISVGFSASAAEAVRDCWPGWLQAGMSSSG